LPGKLLGDGAAALRLPSFTHIGPDGAGDANDVDSAVVGEPLVFKRDNRLAKVWRDPRQRDLNAILRKIVKTGRL
jgi:hypothetical protein